MGLPHLDEVIAPIGRLLHICGQPGLPQASAIQPALDQSQQWFSIWGLSIDTRKTFHWSTDPAERAQLLAQGKSCLTDVKELGGAMTFCRSIRNRELKQRATALRTK